MRELDVTWPPTDEEQAEAKRDLKDVLAEIEPLDTNYELRYICVLLAVTMARLAGYEAGFRIDPAEPDWPVAYIELPTGQVSWHLPAHKVPYDGHSTEEKYTRIKAYIDPRRD